ncbi:MAG: secretin N-terminal domain-containing protein [Chthoniobacteraceae bacterium]
MKPTTLPILILALFAAVAAMAQTIVPVPSPQQIMPPPVPEPQPSAAAAQVPLAPPVNTAPQVPAAPSAGTILPVNAAPAVPPVPAKGSSPASKNEIRMNFQNASLTDVLNYLSEAAGFVIIQNVPVTGTVNIVSKQPVSAEEAVDLLNAVLIDKGYIAIRNGRILKIVSSQNAQKNDLPVEVGSDPENIPRKDGMVTQILPIRYMEAGKLVENLSPLLSSNATISANESSNAIILTDTQTNIHRIAQIIHSLDTSISSISTIRVFPLRYADAKDFANVITQLFSPDAGTSRTGQNNQNPAAAFFGRFGRGGGGGGGGGEPPAPDSAARKAASRVVAVPDEQSNSVVVSAPDEYMSTISDIVSRLDTSTTDITETRIFRLDHADSTATATILNALYGDPSTVSGTNRNAQGQNGQRPNNNNNNNRPQSTASERQLLEARVVAVADPRTNSIIVSCSRETMDQIALTIGRLDATDAKKQHVYVQALEHADPDNVATILRGMFGNQTTSSTSSQPTSSALNQRTTTGASSDVTGTLNTNSTPNSR